MRVSNVMMHARLQCDDVMMRYGGEVAWHVIQGM